MRIKVTKDPRDLAYHQDAKKQELNKACKEAIIDRFEVKLNGVVHFLSNDAEAQGNYGKWERAFDKGIIEEITLTAYDAEGNRTRLTLSEEQFEEVFKAHVLHTLKQLDSYHDLLPKVEKEKKVGKVVGIAWKKN